MDIQAKAIELLETVYSEHGLCTVSCECGDFPTVVDGDVNTRDVNQTVVLIEHARYDHLTPRTVVATVTVTVFDTAWA